MSDPLDIFKAQLDAARRLVREIDYARQEAGRLYSEAWNDYERVKLEMEATVKSYSHLLEGGLVVERRAKFCDISGEEIADGEGAKLVITKGQSRWEADLSAASLETMLNTLNNPDEKKKRGRPAATNGDGAEKEPAEEPAKK